MTTAAFLNVEHSLLGRRWVGPSDAEHRAAEALAQQSHLPLTLCMLLAKRGVEANAIDGFLAPSLRDLLPDPLMLRDMKKAAERLISALTVHQKIAIFADYDVDGGASAALLLIWLREMGHQATLYIPDRIDEGYGPNVEAMQALAAAHDLIICVDCGTLSHEPIAAARAADVVERTLKRE
jgi:single-stranded-DNA-specific exonuclease